MRPTSGPNCFNSALYGNRNQNSIRHTGAAELREYLQSSVCRERGLDEAPASGDLIVIYYQPISFGDILPDGGPIHAFTYISEDYSFSKDGFSKDIPYLLTYNSEVFRKYSVEASLRKVSTSFIEKYRPKTTDELRTNNGFNYAIYYECHPGAQLSTPWSSLSGSLDALNSALVDLELRLAYFLSDGAQLFSEKAQLQAELAQIKASAEAQSFADEGNIMGLRQIKARIESFEDQFTMLQQDASRPPVFW